jgi:monoamine oxidase
MVSMTWDATEGQSGAGAALTAFSGGDAATKCRMSIQQNGGKQYQEILEELLPTYGSNKIGTVFLDWSAIEWTRGGYSFPAPHQVTRVGPILTDGIGRLHFVGEHTCLKFVGYMEGALNSGAVMAKRLVEAGSRATSSAMQPASA